MPPGWERKKFEDGDGLLSDAPSVYIDVVGWAGRQGPADPIAERYETANRAAAVFGRAGTNANCKIGVLT